MKKFLLSFLCFLLAVAGGYAEEVTYTVASTSSVNVSGTAPAGSSATYSSTYSTKCQLTGGNSMTLTLSGFAGNKITGLKMSMKSNTSKGAGGFSAKVGDTVISEIATANFNTSSWAGKWSTSYIDVTPKMNVTDRMVNDGEKIVIKIAATVNSLYCQSFTIMYESAGGGSVTPVAPSAPKLTPSCGFDNEMSVEITNISEGSTVYYTTDESTPSASNGTVYTEPFKITETTTVKAIAVNEAGVSSNVVEATYTMVDPNAKTGTISFASEVQRISQDGNAQVWSNDGITFTNNKASSQNAVVSNVNPVRLYAGSSITIECSVGKINQILFDCNSAEYATELKNSIGDAATASSDKVSVILDGTSNRFSIAKLTKQVRLDALTVTYTAGATEPVRPTLTAGGNFVGSKVIEISCDTEGAKIYYTTDDSEPTKDSREYTGTFVITSKTTVKAIAINDFGSSDVVAATYTRVAATPTISFDGNGTFENAIVVAVDAVEGTTVYYTLNGKAPDNNSDEFLETITLKADVTLQVVAYEGEYKSDIVEQKFTLASSGSAESSTGTATLVKDAADLKAGDQVVIVASDYNYALSTTQNNNNRGQVAITKDEEKVALNDNVQILTLGKPSNHFELYTGSGYLYAASSSSNHLKTETTVSANGRWAINISDGVASIVAQGKNTRNVMRYNQDFSLFSCYAVDKATDQKNISLYKVDLVTIEDPILNVTSASWATLYLGYNVVIPEDVTCYVASEINGESVKLEEVTGVLPANTAVIVKADEGDYEFKVTDVTATAVSPMKGSVKNEYITEEAYVLGIVDGEVGLYKAKMMGGVFLNNANKAYLPATAVQSNAKALKFNFDTTGVEGVKVETAGKKVIYDLSGRRVNEMTQPGIYIVNGKKVMVK